MEFIDSFINFINIILAFEILGLPLYAYLFTFAVIEFVIYMINALKDN